MKIIEAAYIILMVVITYELTMIIHELGHLVMAKLTGYSFVSFRVGPIMLVNESGNLRFRNTGFIKGTGGQCVMMPPDRTSAENTPMLLYFLGGGFFNLLTVLFAVPIGLLINHTYVKAFFLLLGIISGGQAIINLIPSKLVVANDGYSISRIRKSPSDRMALLNSLRISSHPECSFSEMPETYFVCQDEGEYANLSYILRGFYLMDRKDFSGAEKLFLKCNESIGKSNELYHLEATAALLLCMLLRNADDAAIEKIYDDNLKNYLEQTKVKQIDKRCVLYAYHLLHRKDELSANHEYTEMMKLKANASQGDLKTQMMLAEEIRKRSA